MDITQVLVNAQSADAGVRTQAEQQIELAKSSNLPLLMSLMAVELANEAKGMQARQLAGLVLKNCLTAKDSARQQQQSQQWLSFDPGTKNQIKDAVMAALSSSHAGARHTAAQVLAAIGFIDLPNGQWPELIEKLVANVTPTSTNAVKQSSLEALGYICEEIDPEVLEGQSNSILTAVVQGMREADAEVRLAGTTALLHSLGFVKKNFENDNERDYIMQTVCETSLSGDKQIKVKAFECIVSIAEQYYDKLARYMQALYDLTLNRIEAAATGAEDDEVGQQAVEFWTTICDEELDLMEEAEEARQNQQIPERESQNFARGAVPRLMPLLLEALCQQDADDDGEDDAWTVAMAAATCIERMARTIDDAVVAPVMTFIQANITSDDWRRREASTLAFGSILEGPRESTMAPLVDQAMPAMIKLIRDNSLHVKDTAAWTIARICEHHLNKLNEAHLWHMLNVPQPGQPPETLGVLFAGLLDHPRVANNVCLALHNLAEHCEPQRDDETNMLSLKFVDLTRALLQCTERPDAGERNLRCSGYEALNTVLSNAAEDTKPLIEQLLPVILQRLEQSFSLQIVSNDDREAQNELQGLLCGSLQVVTQKLQSRATPQADHMMQLFLQVFRAKNSTVHEEALMAVGAVANATEKNFEKYMPHFRPFLSLGLSNNEEHQVCQVAVGVVGDICRHSK
jgi:importin subunit beta-1